MFAIYEKFDRQPSGKPQKDWRDWSLVDGKVVEKRLHGTCYTETEAIQRVAQLQNGTKNQVYYVDIDNN